MHTDILPTLCFICMDLVGNRMDQSSGVGLRAAWGPGSWKGPVLALPALCLAGPSLVAET